FWFFGASNVELVVKVLDGRSLTGRWWVYYGALSNVEYTMTVTDTVTGSSKSYHNPSGIFASAGDTAALPGAVVADGLTTNPGPPSGTAAAGTVFAASSGAGTPVGSTYDVYPWYGIPSGSGSIVCNLSASPFDPGVTFDGAPESLSSYGFGLARTPRAAESFLDNGDGTSTLRLEVSADDGGDLYPLANCDGVEATRAFLLVGAFPGSAQHDPLDWSPAPVVQSASLDLRRDGATVIAGPRPLDVAAFDAPAGWQGSAAVGAEDAVGKGIDEVVLELLLKNPGAGAGCTPSPTQLCLNQGRFRIAAAWQDFSGRSGVGTAVPLTGDTGYFWFFGASNVELVVKVLDGRPLTGKWWVYYGALSNVEYTMTVTDTVTGNSKSYHNPAGTFASAGDTAALP
ncbi:MAG TPA: hypothetical protein VGV61_17520, partial [Thermoanaerobaculia bacterium]|nr:hypothetical protein [Thermoanaerobaculia bacterium]